MKPQHDDLRTRVLRWQTPPPDPVRKEATLREAIAALATPRPLPLTTPRPVSGNFFRWAAAVAVGSGLAWWFMRPPAAEHESVNTAASAPEVSLATLRDLGELFPGQLDAVIASPSGLDLRLSESASSGPTDQAVQVTLASGSEQATILTYSGRKVRLDFAGAPRCITPLINGDGEVIVLTADQVFSPADATVDDGFRVFATSLANR